MSDGAGREMTLDEFVRPLGPKHRASQELARLRAVAEAAAGIHPYLLLRRGLVFHGESGNVVWRDYQPIVIVPPRHLRKARRAFDAFKAALEPTP